MNSTHPSFPHAHDARSQHLRQELVAVLLQSAQLHSPAIQQAFLTIPREAFVPFFYAEDTTSRTMAWKLVTAQQIGMEDYLAAVYQDQALVTKIDERHWPTSSSSMPSAMANMLEVLDVKPGHRVLEIGTGSGYNAALLSTITGDPCQVVTIEYDASLAATAARALEQVIGSGVTGIVGDGFDGWEQAGPYDRIIATASAATLPHSWVEQLRPGGKLVLFLWGSLASSFLLVEKTTEQVVGHFLPMPWYFMPLITERTRVPHIQTAKLLQQTCHASFVLEEDHLLLKKLSDTAFRWFLQWRIPGCQISKQVQRDTGKQSLFVIEPASQSLVCFQRQGTEGWHANVYGSGPFWRDLQLAYEEFVSLGEPLPQSYQLVVKQGIPLLIIGSCTLSM